MKLGCVGTKKWSSDVGELTHTPTGFVIKLKPILTRESIVYEDMH